MCLTSLAAICNGTLIGFNNEGTVSEIEITIKVSEDDFTQVTTDQAYNKCLRAYKEAKEKEIKAGDWVVGKNAKERIFMASSSIDYGMGFTKLPQNLQDGLNEFIKNQEES